MDFYEFVDACKEEGLTAEQALNEWNRAQAEAEADFFEDYYNDPVVQYGWYQQDLIDMHRRER